MIRNDERSMWLVGEEDGEVRIGFVVSFTQPTAQFSNRVSAGLENSLMFSSLKRGLTRYEKVLNILFSLT